MEQHLKRNTSRMIALQSLDIVKGNNRFDMYITVAGGGTNATAKVRVYAVNYNVLRVMSGMGGLAYSN